MAKTPSITLAQITNGWAINGANGVDDIDATFWFNGKTGTIWQIVGGNGADTIRGSSRSEIIWGDSKNDSDTSSNGADTIYGGGGNDEIHGGNGADYLQGDDGADHLYGGRGADVFDYNVVDDSESAAGGTWSSATGDWIHDFSKADGDKLDLRGLNGQLTGAGHPDKLTLSDTPNAAYGVWIGSYSGGDKIVYADTNGDGVADVAIRVTGSIDASSIVGANHGPVAHGGSNSVTEDQAVSGTVAGNDSDPDGDTLTYSVCGTGPTGLTLDANGSYTFDASSYDYLAQGETTTVIADVKVSDGHGGIAHESLSITITGVNDAATFSGDDSGDADETGSGGIQLFSLIDSGTASGQLVVDDVDGADTVQVLDTDTDHGHFAIDADGNWTFTVDQDNDEVQQLNDGDEITETITVHSADGTAHDITITIHGANDAAEFSGDDSGDVTEDSGDPITASGDLGVTDVDNAGTITASEQDGDYGHFSIGADGHWTYTLDNSNAAVNALNDDSTPLTETFTVTSDDGTEQQVTVTINGANDAPVADDGGDTGSEDSIISGTATASDPDDSTLTFSYDHDSAPAGFSMDGDGNWTLDASNAAYQGLGAGDHMDVELDYSVADGHGGSDTGHLTITVNGVNDAPGLTGDAASLANAIEDTPYTVSDADLLAGWNDADGDTLSVTDLTVNHGSIEANGDGTYTVTLDANYNGPVTFNYNVTDGTEAVAASLGATVDAVNDGPTGTAITDHHSDEDTALEFSVAGSFSDVDGPTLTYSATLQGGGDLPEWLSFDTSTGTFTGTPPQDYNGSVEVTVSASDGEYDTSQDFSIVIDAVNDGPTSTAITDHHSDEDTAIDFSVASSFADVDGPTLTYSAQLQGGGDLPDWLSFDGDTGTFTGTPPQDYHGSTTVTVTASDGSLTSSEDFSIVIDSVNDNPTAGSPNSVTTNEDSASDPVLIGAGDVDGDTLSYSTKDGEGPANGSVSYDQEAGTFTYTPDADYHGSDSFTIVIDDGNGGSTEQLVTVTVNSVNDDPAATSPNSVTTNEDSASDPVLIGAGDVDGDTLSYSTKGGAAPQHGAVTYDQGAGTFTYTPTANYNGSDSFTIVVSDGHGGTAEQVVSVTVNAVNDAPTAAATNSVTTNEDTISSAVAIGGSDVDGDTLSYSTKAGAGPAIGAVSYDQAAGTFTYTPTANSNGSDSFTIVISDGHGGMTEQVVSVTVNAVDDAGSIGGTDTGSVTEDAATNTASGTLTLTDVDGPSGFVVQTNAGGTYGAFSVDASGNWTYTLNNADTDTNALGNSDHPTETFTVTANDGATHNVVVTVNGHTDVTYTSPTVYSGADIDYDHDGDEASHKVSPGPVIISDDPGAHTLYGSDSADTINAGTGNDNVYGYGGNDVIDGQGGQDVSLYGQAGNDTLSGGQGADKIYGGSGADTIYGNNAADSPDDNQADTIYAGSGNDTVFGNNGNDLIYGNFGADTISGGLGADTFVYVSNKDTGDTITDFSHAQADKIDLSALGITAAGFIGDTTDPGGLGSHQAGFHYNGSQTIIYADTDGVAGADLEIKLSGNVGLVSSDFIFHA